MTLSLLHRCRRDGTGAVVMAPVPRYTLGEKIGTGHNDGTGANLPKIDTEECCAQTHRSQGGRSASGAVNLYRRVGEILSRRSAR